MTTRRWRVTRILGDGTRQRTRAFTYPQSHHLFRDRFGRPGKGNDKGKVEALVKTARRRFMVPIPKMPDLDGRLTARRLERLDALAEVDKAASLLADLDALRDLPGTLDQAAPLKGWKLDPAVDALRRLLEARFGPRGKGDDIQVLCLLEDFPETLVTAAVQDAVKRRLIGFEPSSTCCWRAPKSGPQISI